MSNCWSITTIGYWDRLRQWRNSVITVQSGWMIGMTLGFENLTFNLSQQRIWSLDEVEMKPEFTISSWDEPVAAAMLRTTTKKRLGEKYHLTGERWRWFLSLREFVDWRRRRRRRRAITSGSRFEAAVLWRAGRAQWRWSRRCREGRRRSDRWTSCWGPCPGSH